MSSSALSLAESMLQSGNVAAAFKLLSDFPDPSARRNFLLGQCAVRMGNAAVAISALATALAADPCHAPAATLLGEVYIKLGMVDKAEALFRTFLARTEDAGLRVLRARLMAAQGNFEGALGELGTALKANPRHPMARQDRGDILVSLHRYPEAAQEYRELTVHYPGEVAAWANLGVVESWSGNFDEAERCLRRALEVQPGNGKCMFELALTLIKSGRPDEARIYLEQLPKADPKRWKELQLITEKQQSWTGDGSIDPTPLFLSYTYAKLDQCDWTLLDAYDRVFAQLAEEPRSNPAGGAHCAGAAVLDASQRRRVMEAAARFTLRDITPWVHEPTPAPERLRIGYVLPRLGAHVVAGLMERVWALHTDQVEVVVFSTALSADDYGSATLQRVTALPNVRWVDLTKLDDAQAAAVMRDQSLDVLVDLGVYNDGAKPGQLAWRPAPVQVNYLGAPFTSGAPWMDYIITDAVVSPGIEGWCSEAEVTMPSCYFTFGNYLETPPPVPPRASIGLPEGVFIYSGLHAGYKVEPEIFGAWMRILKATPGSVLLLKDGAHIRPNLLREAAARGIGPERLLFAARLDEVSYIGRQGAVDLFLDAHRYSGHTTMAESLWMGAPALSWPGDGFHNRVGASLLTSVGLGEMVMPDLASYEATAIALFHDRTRLAALRERLLAQRLQAAPFDVAGQVRALEKAYRHMRRQFAEGRAPAPFRVADLDD